MKRALHDPSPDHDQRSAGLRTHGLMLLAYLALAIWLAWPAPAHLVDTYYTHGNTIFFLHGTPEADLNIWNSWWGLKAIASGQNPFYSPLLYYPQGVQMFVQTIDFSSMMLMLPVTWLLGPVAAYNVSVIVNLVLTGYVGFLLVRRFGVGLLGAFMAGALLTACPFHIAKVDIGQLNFVSMQWLVLFMLTIVNLADIQETGPERTPLRNDLIPALLAVLAFLSVFFTDWYWLIIGVAFGGLWMLLGLIGSPQPWRLIRRYLIFGALTSAICIPLLISLMTGFASHVATSQEQAMWDLYIQGYSADAFGIFFPAALNPLWGGAVEQFLLRVAPYGITEGSYTAAGWVLAGLGLVGAWHYRRSHWRLIVTGLICWLFSPGPTLYVLGFNTGLPMPYRLFQLLPMLSTARRPNLFAIITIIILVIFAGLALSKLQASLTPRRFRLAYTGLAILAICELWPPPRAAYRLPHDEVFQRIAAAPGVVVDLPVEGDNNSRTLRNQLTHGQPILRGYLARPPDEPNLSYNPLVNRLSRMRVWQDGDIIALDPAALQTMQCYYRFRYVVEEKALLSAEQRADVSKTLRLLVGTALEPWYEDKRFVAYELPISAEPCAPFLFLGTGWSEIERNASTSWRWTSSSSHVYMVNPDKIARTFVFDFRVEGRAEGQPLDIVIGDQVVHLKLKRAIRSYQVAITLPPGLNLAKLETPTQGEGEKRDLGISVESLAIR